MTPRRQDSETPSWLMQHHEDDPYAVKKELGRMEAVPPAPPELCHFPAQAERSFDPRFIRNLLRPIGLTLSGLFGFQTAQPLSDADKDGEWIRSNLDNQVEHLTQLLKWRMYAQHGLLSNLHHLHHLHHFTSRRHQLDSDAHHLTL